MPSTFLICPVRGHDSSETESAVRELEARGWRVHWPHRDTDQHASAFAICEQNCSAIKLADVVHVIWDGKSQGCLFDLGVAFALGKPIRIIHIPPSTHQRGFQEMMRIWEQFGTGNKE